jgi:hypothetical protein
MDQLSKMNSKVRPTTTQHPVKSTESSRCTYENTLRAPHTSILERKRDLRWCNCASLHNSAAAISPDLSTSLRERSALGREKRRECRNVCTTCSRCNTDGQRTVSVRILNSPSLPGAMSEISSHQYGRRNSFGTWTITQGHAGGPPQRILRSALA